MVGDFAMAYRARKSFGTIEKRAPGRVAQSPIKLTQTNTG